MSNRIYDNILAITLSKGDRIFFDDNGYADATLPYIVLEKEFEEDYVSIKFRKETRGSQEYNSNKIIELYIEPVNKMTISDLEKELKDHLENINYDF